MNVLHLSTFDVRGGAALAAYRLHRALLKRKDCSSRMLVREKYTRDPEVSVMEPSMMLPDRVRRVLERRKAQREHAAQADSLKKVELFSDDRGWWADRIAENVQGADVIQLHWICQFLNYGRFFKSVPVNIPLVWRLADKNPLTGGCHYDGGCGRFQAECGRCPALES